MSATRIPFYKTIVIGASGLVGSSALRAAAEIYSESTSLTTYPTPSVLGIDQYEAGHDLGSSHGETRITRLAIGEGPDYVDLAIRSHEIWEQVEEETKGEFGKLINLKKDTGVSGLIIGPKDSQASYHGSNGGFMQETTKIAENNAIAHENLQKGELEKRFPQFKFRENDAGYLEETMGFINPDACIKANVSCAKDKKAEVRTGITVTHFEKLENNKTRVFCIDKNNKEILFDTDKLIIAAGPWIRNLMGKEDLADLKVMRQTVYWFDVKEERRTEFCKDKFPTYIWNLDSDNIVYGFPLQDNTNAIKVGTESYKTITTPETVDRNVSEAEINNVYETLVKPYFPDITNHCAKAKVCLYTVAPGHKFMVDFYKGNKNIVVASPCSGHGAKHAAAIGEAIAQQVILGKSNIPVIEKFGGLLTPKIENTISLTYASK